MGRKISDSYSNKFSIRLTDEVAYCLRRHAHYHFLNLSDIVDEAVAAWLIDKGIHTDRTDIENTYQMEK